jgi:signal transduction histidine kinase
MAALVRNLHRVNGSADLDPKVRTIVAESVALAEKSTRDVRTLSYLLHPPLLDEVGLASALSWYVKGFSQRSGIHVDLTVPTEYRRLPAEVERALFRIVQESLNNVHRHSASASARIELAVDKDTVHLEVRDEGRGIPSETLRKFHTGSAGLGVGVAGMRERIRQLGGHLDIESSGRGATVRAILPLSGAV